jgi:CubicO group peptidase (beta-lactamase class C family)
LAEPVGCTSVQDDDVRRVVRGRARGYVRVGEELRNSRLMDSSYKLAGGGFCSSAVDLAKFGDAVLAGRVVPDDWIERMWTSGTLPEGGATGYGLGFAVGKLGGDGPLAELRAISHSGAQAQVSTYWLLLPNERVTVVVLCNLEGLKLEAITKRIARTVL